MASFAAPAGASLISCTSASLHLPVGSPKKTSKMPETWRGAGIKTHIYMYISHAEVFGVAPQQEEERRHLTRSRATSASCVFGNRPWRAATHVCVCIFITKLKGGGGLASARCSTSVKGIHVGRQGQPPRSITTQTAAVPNEEADVNYRSNKSSHESQVPETCGEKSLRKKHEGRQPHQHGLKGTGARHACIRRP